MKRVRIILVEDNPTDVLLVEETLKALQLEFTLQRYINGEQAARAFAGMTEPPDLILVDLNLPRIHGFELLQLIRANAALAHSTVAVLTSSTSAADRTSSEQCGADAHIVKPAGYYDFVAEVGGSIRILLERPVGEATFPGARPPMLPPILLAAGLAAALLEYWRKKPGARSRSLH